MTTIKIEDELSIKGCSTCPFCVTEAADDYADFSAYCNILCNRGLYLIDCDCVDTKIDNEKPRDNKRDNCPIISIEKA